MVAPHESLVGAGMTGRLDYGAGTFRGEALEKKGVQDLEHHASCPEPLGVFEYTASHDLKISGAEEILFACVGGEGCDLLEIFRVDVGKDLLTNIKGNCLESFSTPDAEDLAHETVDRILDGVEAEPTFCTEPRSERMRQSQVSICGYMHGDGLAVGWHG